MHSSSFLPVFRSAHHDALLLLEFVLRAVLLRLNGVEHLLLLLRRNAGRNGLRLSLRIALLLLVGLCGVLLLALVALYALKRILARYGKGLGDLFKPAPPQPPHVVAIKALEALHNQKLWQNNRHKQYYSGLTDILRTYIAARWGVGAMEMTSDEIIEAMRSEELPDKARMDLTAILRDADLVKFAKATPDGEQNEADYLKAFYFVEETKLVVEEEEPEQPDPMQNQNA